MPSREHPEHVCAWRWLLEKELRELAASRSYWLLLLVVGVLVGHAFITSANLYAEASGTGGGPAALSQGLSPLEGIVVPTFGAYDLAATLLFPFVVIRLVASEKQTGALALHAAGAGAVRRDDRGKGDRAARRAGSSRCSPAASRSLLWRAIGGHLDAAGDVERGARPCAARRARRSASARRPAALAASAASAAIVALTITLGTWALDYVAAARGGALAAVAEYTPSAALRVFEHGELRVATVLVMLDARHRRARDRGGRGSTRANARASRGARSAVVVATVVAACCCVRRGCCATSRDVSEDRRNSFPRADERALRAIDEPLRVTVVSRGGGSAARRSRARRARQAAADDARTSTSSTRRRAGAACSRRRAITTARSGTTLGGRREMTRSSTEEIVLETIYRLAGRAPPAAVDEAAYRGYPLRARADGRAVGILCASGRCWCAAVWWLPAPSAWRGARQLMRRMA